MEHRFGDGTKAFLPWFALFALAIYGAGLGWILPEGRAELWGEILRAHLYASHIGILAAITCWLFLEDESRLMKGILFAIALIATTLYLTEFWGTPAPDAEIPFGSYLRGMALGAAYILALWIVKYRFIPEVRKLFR